MNKKECCICLQNSSTNIVTASSQSATRLLDVSVKWLKLDSEVEQTETSHRIQSTIKNNPNIDLYYHRQCYQRFTDKSKIERLVLKEKNERKVSK